MTLEQLRIFVAAADRGHVTQAAKSLGITQSAASAAISALETQYGAQLFNRVGRGIELSETGSRFLPAARAVLDRAATARAILQELSDLAAGRLTIAASQTIATYWLPRRLASYHLAFPAVSLHVQIGNTRQVEAAVVEGAAQIGLVEGATRHPSLVRRRVDQDRLILVTGAGQPSLPEIEPGRPDLKAIRWVLREVGSGTRAVIEDLARTEGMIPDDLDIFLVLPSNEAVREAVEAGAGATIISEHVVNESIAAGRLKAISIQLPPREFALVFYRERYVSDAQCRLVEHLMSSGTQEQIT